MQKKSLETILYSSAGIVLMLAIIVAVNVITGVKPVRVDMTQEKAFTLSDGTRAVLKKLDMPVKIRFYCTQSETATPETVYLKDYARKVEDLLHEYKQIAGKNLIIEKFDPQPDSDAEDSAKLDGLEPQPLQGMGHFYLGLAVSLRMNAWLFRFWNQTAKSSWNTTSRGPSRACSRRKNRRSA